MRLPFRWVWLVLCRPLGLLAGSLSHWVRRR